MSSAATHEQWKPVPGYGGHYEASTLGRVRAKRRLVVKQHRNGTMMQQTYPAKILRQKPGIDGYVILHIGVDGEKISIGAHILVLLAFKGPCPAGMEACHFDGNASNNRPENLRWDTHYNNAQDRARHGNYAHSERHVMAKLTPQQVEYIRLSPKTGRQLARELHMGESQISRIRRGVSWQKRA